MLLVDFFLEKKKPAKIFIAKWFYSMKASYFSLRVQTLKNVHKTWSGSYCTFRRISFAADTFLHCDYHHKKLRKPKQRFHEKVNFHLNVEFRRVFAWLITWSTPVRNQDLYCLRNSVVFGQGQPDWHIGHLAEGRRLSRLLRGQKIGGLHLWLADLPRTWSFSQWSV